MSDEWGPWIEHDGIGCPVQKGTVCHVIYNKKGICPYTGDWTDEIVAAANGGPAWISSRGYSFIIRYRIRKPRGLTILHKLLQDLPEQVDA